MHKKSGLVMGVANQYSVAWAIAKKLKEQGANIALTVQGDIFAKRVLPLAQNINISEILFCDAENEEEIDKVFNTLAKKWTNIDFVVHALAWSEKTQLQGEYVNVSKDNFLRSMDISCYSFTSICKKALPLMREKGGSLLTMSYYGAEKVMPNYNMMGIAKAALEASVKYLAVDLGKHNIRVNAISAGPIKTLAASGIGDFRYILKWHRYNSPMHRNIIGEEIANSALYLLSDLSSAVSGEIHHVDCGYNVVGMKAVDAPDISKV